jgi:hypothetical protein
MCDKALFLCFSSFLVKKMVKGYERKDALLKLSRVYKVVRFFFF